MPRMNANDSDQQWLVQIIRNIRGFVTPGVSMPCLFLFLISRALVGPINATFTKS